MGAGCSDGSIKATLPASAARFKSGPHSSFSSTWENEGTALISMLELGWVMGMLFGNYIQNTTVSQEAKGYLSMK